MNNISWLESLATITRQDSEFSNILKMQSPEIESAYRSNDQKTLKVLLGGDRLACKKTIFQL